MKRTLTSKRLRAMLWLAADGKCQICGKELPENWHADHIIPWVKSPVTNMYGMQALCPECNRRKGQHDGSHEGSTWTAESDRDRA